ncbi:hypothetical protein SAMD00019534_120200 [Acytostelium subglobosum LB1]|uniref:hypothetical protein n=1 Tax=Acytostelium subglobosum LB1 TaxID=1410327 RepID=UPI0006450C19|nr:hypothetical protein SAMD00019534_120200 [Acytostelium subglobosum LB1]GAM28844.1 hypothetical protein SAMD00019534_120200 [Acytostelium subglobosum LB1]|eukprot:XP_012748216.1 hypothetical protein SAMD00019534_120200 [Acytostelium subglobosum LB1]
MNCIVYIYNLQTSINIAMGQDTTIAQLKANIVQTASSKLSVMIPEANIVVSLSPQFDNIIKSVPWTKVLSLDQIKRLVPNISEVLLANRQSSVVLPLYVATTTQPFNNDTNIQSQQQQANNKRSATMSPTKQLSGMVINQMPQPVLPVVAPTPVLEAPAVQSNGGSGGPSYQAVQQHLYNQYQGYPLPYQQQQQQQLQPQQPLYMPYQQQQPQPQYYMQPQQPQYQQYMPQQQSQFFMQPQQPQYQYIVPQPQQLQQHLPQQQLQPQLQMQSVLPGDFTITNSSKENNAPRPKPAFRKSKSDLLETIKREYGGVSPFAKQTSDSQTAAGFESAAPQGDNTSKSQFTPFTLPPLQSMQYNPQQQQQQQQQPAAQQQQQPTHMPRPKPIFLNQPINEDTSQVSFTTTSSNSTTIGGGLDYKQSTPTSPPPQMSKGKLGYREKDGGALDLKEFENNNSNTNNTNVPEDLPSAQKKRSSSFTSTWMPNFRSYQNMNTAQQQPQYQTTPIGSTNNMDSIANGASTSSGGLLSFKPLGQSDEITPSFQSFRRQSLLDGAIIHQGDLYKKNRSGVGWKRQWYILTSKKLLRCSSQNDAPSSELSLSDHVLNVLSSETKYSCFSLTSNTGSGNFIFGCESEESRKDWLCALTITSHALNITLDLGGLEIISIPNHRGTPSEKEFEYHKLIPSDIRVSHYSEDIALFRSKMLKMFKIASKWMFTLDHKLPVEMNGNKKQNISPSSGDYTLAPSTPVKSNGTHNNNSNSKVNLLSVSVISQYAQNAGTLVKLSVYHNGLVIKFKVDVNQTIGSILLARPDLFENNPKRYGLNILGSMEHVFDHAIRLSDLAYVTKCLRFRKAIKFQTVDMQLHTKLFTYNTMTTNEWSAFMQSMNSFDDQDTIKAHIVRAKKILPAGVESTKLTISVMNVANVQTLLRQFGVPPNQVSKIPLCVEMKIFYGNRLLSKGRTSAQVTGEWNEKIYFNIKTVDLPKEAIIIVDLLGKITSSTEPITLAQYPMMFMNADGRKVIYTEYDLQLISFSPKSQLVINNMISDASISTISLSIDPNNVQAAPTLKLHIAGVSNGYPIYFEEPDFPTATNVISPQLPTPSELLVIESCLRTHRTFIKESEKSILWKHRFHLKTSYPNILPSLMYSVPFEDYQKRYEVYELIGGWPLLDPKIGLELLSADFIDAKLREKGIESINQWDDNTLALYLPQVVNSLKFEQTHYSPLSCFLVKRALCNPFTIGGPLFWLCANDMSPEKGNSRTLYYSIRFKLVMEALLYGLGLSASQGSMVGQSILQQYLIIQNLKQINLEIIKEPDKQQKILETRLSNIPKQFTLPTHPLQEFNTFILEECKVKDSNAAPLWLVFSSVTPGADDTKIIFKKDDVRPDELCLQLFAVMDNILKDNGIDCNFTLFKCISVGSGLGVIEVVPRSVTLGDFVRRQDKYKSIEEWLRKKNPDNNSDYIDIFLKSCAAYCVATYLLGIYDRHNDNLMVSDTGHFFHIDFGYYLGKVTKFLFLDRETAPFVLTKDIVKVMGAREKEYKDYCVKIYNILRRNSREILNLISMIKSDNNGIELLRERMKLDLTDRNAEQHFLELVKESKKNLRSEINNAIHVMVHP